MTPRYWLVPPVGRIGALAAGGVGGAARRRGAGARTPPPALPSSAPAAAAVAAVMTSAAAAAAEAGVRCGRRPARRRAPALAGAATTGTASPSAFRKTGPGSAYM